VCDSRLQLRNTSSAVERAFSSKVEVCIQGTSKHYLLVSYIIHRTECEVVHIARSKASPTIPNIRPRSDEPQHTSKAAQSQSNLCACTPTELLNLSCELSLTSDDFGGGAWSDRNTEYKWKIVSSTVEISNVWKFIKMVMMSASGTYTPVD
jgi:hypothetical protein